VVDGGQRRIILGVLVAPGEVMENQPMLDQAWHVRFRFHLSPYQVTGDTTYGTIENSTALEWEGIRAYLPLPDWEQRTPYFGLRQFTYDGEHDVYMCPQGYPLRFLHTDFTTASRSGAPRATTVGWSIGISPSRIWTGCGPTIRASPMPRRCASARCGSNRS
jgi:hypothetical protein